MEVKPVNDVTLDDLKTRIALGKEWLEEFEPIPGLSLIVGLLFQFLLGGWVWMVVGDACIILSLIFWVLHRDTRRYIETREAAIALSESLGPDREIYYVSEIE